MTPAALRARAEAATPGPWEQDEYENWRVGSRIHDWVAFCGTLPGAGPDPSPLRSERDAALIAAANPQTIKLLCDLWEAASKYLTILDANGIADDDEVRTALSALDSHA